MTPPPRPSPRPSLGPERLTELLDDAVRHVTAPGDALDRIRRGVRRRRTARRAGVVLLAVAVLAGGGSTALAVTSGHGPSGLAAAGSSTGSSSTSSSSSSVGTSPSGVGAGAQRPTTGMTLVSAPPSSAASGSSGASGSRPAPASSAAPPEAVPASAPSTVPSAASSRDSQAKAAYPSLGQPSSWDMDGDGRPDTATIVPVGNISTTSSFRLVVHLTRLGTQTVAFTATSMTGMPPHGPVIVGGADAAHDGRAELFVLVDAGCCTEFWTIFRLVNGHVRQMIMSGQPVRLAVGGTVTNNGGFSCTGPDLVTYAYQPETAAGTFLATLDTYRWAGAALVLASHQRATIHGTASTRYTGVSCGTLPQYVSAR